MSNFLFVYGTLRHRYPGGMAELLRTNAELVQENYKLPGKMYNLGGFPGVLPSTDSSVQGDVYKFTSDDVFSALDRYEGHPVLFERRKTLITVDGEDDPVDCWVYYFNKDTEGRALVEDGDWLRVAATRR